MVGGARRRRRRPRSRDDAEHAGDRRAACSRRRRWARRGRPARRISASAACSTASARSSPRSSLRCDGYWYAGKRIDIRREAGRDRARSCRRVGDRDDRRLSRRPAGAGGAPACRAPRHSRPPSRPMRSRGCAFTRLPFNHPLYILYSSGTTGVPKCIVHGAGGTLLQHLKEHRLHCDVRAGRPRLLFHDLRLDDVELAGLGPRLRRDAAALRRLAVPSPAIGAVRLRASRSGSRCSAPRPSTSTRATRPGFEPRDTHDLAERAAARLDRLAAGAGELRLRL